MLLFLLQTSHLRRKPAIRVKTVSSSANSSPGMYGMRGMCGMSGMIIVSDVSQGVSHGVSDRHGTVFKILFLP